MSAGEPGNGNDILNRRIIIARFTKTTEALEMNKTTKKIASVKLWLVALVMGSVGVTGCGKTVVIQPPQPPTLAVPTSPTSTVPTSTTSTIPATTTSTVVDPSSTTVLPGTPSGTTIINQRIIVIRRPRIVIRPLPGVINPNSSTVVIIKK